MEAKEMTQSAKCLLSKYENPSPYPVTEVKNKAKNWLER